MDKSALTHRERRIVEAAAGGSAHGAIWGSSPELVVNHGVLCAVSFPYRDPKPQRSFTRISGSTALEITAGKIPAFEGAFQEVGLPYGSRARLLMVHLCSMALKNNSPIVQLDRSFSGFARELGINPSGYSLGVLREQSLRLGAASVLIRKTTDDSIIQFQGHIFDTLRFQIGRPIDQKGLFPSDIVFNRQFFESLSRHAVPLSKPAVYALKHSARGLDILFWLSSRLWRIDPRKPVTVKWTSLRFQFGNPDQQMRSFKTAFKTALRQALAVYPDARVEIIRGGLKLENSRPPVPPREGRLLGV